MKKKHIIKSKSYLIKYFPKILDASYSHTYLETQVKKHNRP